MTPASAPGGGLGLLVGAKRVDLRPVKAWFLAALGRIVVDVRKAVGSHPAIDCRAADFQPVGGFLEGHRRLLLRLSIFWHLRTNDTRKRL
jgi:hypothetical protein